MDKKYNRTQQFSLLLIKLNPEIDPTCRLCLQANETLHHLMTDCEATSTLQMDIMKNQIPLPDMTWSVKDINKFIQHPLIHSLMTYDSRYNNREIEYIEHNYSSDASSLLTDPLILPRRRSWWRVAWDIRVVKQTPDPGAEDAELVILTPVGLPCLERGRLYKKVCQVRSKIKTWFTFLLLWYYLYISTIVAWSQLPYFVMDFHEI